MKVLLSLILVSSLFAFKSSESKNNVNKHLVLIDGYDVVAYFSNEAKKGVNDHKYYYDGAMLMFANAQNLQLFKANPKMYMPQYGGWCAYAMATDGTKVEIDPETYEIRDEKLYLFYNKLLTNTLELWLKEGHEKLKAQADKNWQTITSK